MEVVYGISEAFPVGQEKRHCLTITVYLTPDYTIEEVVNALSSFTDTQAKEALKKCLVENFST